jgi:tellurite resistance protein TerC
MITADVPGWGWLAFGALVVVLLAIDLLAHRGHRGLSRRSAVIWSLIWIGAGLAFGGVVWRTLGANAAEEYFAAYLIEKSLSVDNLFVFLVIFSALAIPATSQRRGLWWGIFGALVFRAVFIVLGVRALEQWHWVVYVFGGILLVAAIQVVRKDPVAQRKSRTVEVLMRFLPVTNEQPGKRFFARREGKLVATPLLVAVIAIELTDIAFAVDSVPAALAVSRDPFVVYSSNVFAILGLRALYLVLAGLVARLRYLRFGLAGVLAFAAFKMIAGEWLALPPLLSVLIIAVTMGAAVAASLLRARRERRRSAARPGGGRTRPAQTAGAGAGEPLPPPAPT